MTIVVPRYVRGAVDAPAGAFGVPGSRSDFLTRGPNGRARAPAGGCLAGLFVSPRTMLPGGCGPRRLAPVRGAGRSAHELRHVCASLLIASGASDIQVARQMGHSRIETTKNIYGHLFAQDQAAILDARNQAVSRLYV